MDSPQYSVINIFPCNDVITCFLDYSYSQRTYRSYGTRQSPEGWFTPGTRGKASRYGYATQPVTYGYSSQATSQAISQATTQATTQVTSQSTSQAQVQSQVVEVEIVRQTSQQLEGLAISQQTQAAQQAVQQTQAAQQAAQQVQVQQVQATQQTTQQTQQTQQTGKLLCKLYSDWNWIFHPDNLLSR